MGNSKSLCPKIETEEVQRVTSTVLVALKMHSRGLAASGSQSKTPTGQSNRNYPLFKVAESPPAVKLSLNRARLWLITGAHL